MNSSDYDPGRRQVLAAALLPGLEKLLEPLKRKPNAYNEWFIAVQADDALRCRQLMQRGFDPNTLEAERFDTALILTVRHKSWKVFSLLVASPATHLDARSRNGDTALMIAAFSAETVAAQTLIDKGAEINRPGWTALHYAAASGSLPIILKLLEKSAYIDAESPNKTTPLMMAARGGHQAAVTLLIKEGADVSLKNELGLTATDFANSQNHAQIARLLNKETEKTQTPVNTEQPAEPESLPDKQ